MTYNGPIPQAIYRFKYAGRRTLADPFAVLLSGAFDRYFEFQPVDGLVAVPLHRRNQSLRGYNQASLLAQALSRRIGVPVADDLLARVRPTRPQFRLTRAERQENLRGAFRLHPRRMGASSIKGRSFLLIDDICTTGATLAGCARRLRQAGAARVAALVLARDL